MVLLNLTTPHCGAIGINITIKETEESVWRRRNRKVFPFYVTLTLTLTSIEDIYQTDV